MAEGAAGELGEVLARIDERMVRAEEKGAERSAEANRRHREVTRRFDVVDRQLERTNDRLDSLVRAVVTAMVSLTCGMLAGFGAILVLIATQI